MNRDKRDKKYAMVKEMKAKSEGLLGGYVVGLMMLAVFFMADATVFGVFATIFLGLLSFIAIYWYAKVSGMEERGD